MKRKTLIISLIVALAIIAVGVIGSFNLKNKKQDNTNNEPIKVLAAASLTDACNEIKGIYEKKYNEKISFSFGSSGALQTQIEEGANADIFMSAAESQMATLVQEGFVDKSKVKKLLKNDVVLIVPKNSSKKIKTFMDLNTSKVSIVGLGEPDSVPAGKYAKQALDNLNIWDSVSKKANFGTDVRTVLTWVEGNEVDCGIVYKTDALISKKVKIIDVCKNNMCDDVIYPIAQLKHSKLDDRGRKLVEFMESNECKEIFKKYGFARY